MLAVVANDVDRQVGKNISALRGRTSQSTLASAMRDRGWKWTQPTVAAIEKGERPLKLAEADDLVEVLRAGSIDDLVSRPLESLWWATYESYWEARQALQAANRAYIDARYELAEVADQMAEAGETSDEIDISSETLAWVKNDIISVGLDPTSPRLPDIGPNAGPHLQALAVTDYVDYYHFLATPRESFEATAIRRTRENPTGLDHGPAAHTAE